MLLAEVCQHQMFHAKHGEAIPNIKERFGYVRVIRTKSPTINYNYVIVVSSPSMNIKLMNV